MSKLKVRSKPYNAVTASTSPFHTMLDTLLEDLDASGGAVGGAVVFNLGVGGVLVRYRLMLQCLADTTNCESCDGTGLKGADNENGFGCD